MSMRRRWIALGVAVSFTAAGVLFVAAVAFLMGVIKEYGMAGIVGDPPSVQSGVTTLLILAIPVAAAVLGVVLLRKRRGS